LKQEERAQPVVNGGESIDERELTARRELKSKRAIFLKENGISSPD